MDLIQIGVDPETHTIKILEDSPQSRIDRYWTEIKVVLPEELKDYSVRLNFELPVPKEDGTYFYPFFWLTEVPFVTPPKILLSADNQKIPIRVFLTKTEPISGVKESWSSVNTVVLGVANARKMEIDDPNWLLDLGYENAFVKAVIDWKEKTVTLTQLDDDEVVLPFTEMLRNGQVSYEVHQDITEEQKEIARKNIDAVSQKDHDDYKEHVDVTYLRRDGGNYEWDVDFVYTKDAIVVLGNDIFKSTADMNVGNDPLEEDSAFWLSMTKKRFKNISEFFVIGNGIDREFDISHNFGTRYVFVELMQTKSPYEHVRATPFSTTVNKVKLRFANPPKTNEYVVVISPSGGTTKHVGYTHVQEEPSAEWLINHDLDRMVIAQTYDENGNQIIGVNKYIDDDNIKTIFINPHKGHGVIR